MIITIPADGLIILVAPAAVGKSTFARRHFLETEIVSSDRCRALVSDDEANQAATRAAFGVFWAILRGRLRLGRLSVADATNLEPTARKGLLNIAAQFERPVVAIVLDVPQEVAQAQNAARSRAVPPHILTRHYESFSVAREALPTEGYAAIYEIPRGDSVEIRRVARESLSP